MRAVLPNFEDHATLFLIIMTHIASVQGTGRASLLPGVAKTAHDTVDPPSSQHRGNYYKLALQATCQLRQPSWPLLSLLTLMLTPSLLLS
ncbi:hypothetical protein AOLI_G00298760 [Acnodon oligacanthus]